MGSMGNMTAIRNSVYPKIAKACVKAVATSPFYRRLNLIRDDFTIFYSGLDSFDAAFVGLPGEIFCEFGMDIKSASPCKNTMVMGETNDARSYFPTRESFTQGPEGFTPMITGYETTPGQVILSTVALPHPPSAHLQVSMRG